jgi:hypothetical protein
MSSSPRCRWDLVAGSLASLIAIGGLGMGIGLGNTNSVAGAVDFQFQRALLGLAGTFLVLVLVKTLIRCRRNAGAICSCNVETWLRGRRR